MYCLKHTNTNFYFIEHLLCAGNYSENCNQKGSQVTLTDKPLPFQTVLPTPVSQHPGWPWPSLWGGICLLSFPGRLQQSTSGWVQCADSRICPAQTTLCASQQECMMGPHHWAAWGRGHLPHTCLAGRLLNPRGPGACHYFKMCVFIYFHSWSTNTVLCFQNWTQGRWL